MCKPQEKTAINQAITSTLNMVELDADMDVIKARLAVIEEIARGLDIDIKLPSVKSLLVRRFINVAYK